MRAVTLLFSAAGQQSYTPPNDTQFVGYTGSQGVLVTTDPSLVLTDLSAPGANRSLSTVLIYTTAITAVRPTVAVNCVGGQKLYVTVGAAGAIILYFTR